MAALRLAVGGLICVSASIAPTHLEGQRPARDQFAAWSPDGRSIAFQSDRHGNLDLFVIQADGSGLRQVTSGLANDYHPVWSPDGARILFHSDDNGRSDIGTEDLDIYSVAADGSDRQAHVTHAGNDYFPVYAPDGNRVAFVSDRRGDRDVFNVYVRDLVAGTTINLTRNLAEAFDPGWSPDGARVAFSAPNPEHDGVYDIYAVNDDGTQLVNLTDNPARHDFNPDWSPDGRSIAFQAGINGPAHIVVLDLDTHTTRPLTAGHETRELPAWSPDGTRIAYTGWTDGNADIYVMNVDGTGVVRLTIR